MGYTLGYLGQGSAGGPCSSRRVAACGPDGLARPGARRSRRAVREVSRFSEPNQRTAAGEVRFSNRPFEVKRFQTIHLSMAN